MLTEKKERLPRRTTNHSIISQFYINWLRNATDDELSDQYCTLHQMFFHDRTVGDTVKEYILEALDLIKKEQFRRDPMWAQEYAE